MGAEQPVETGQSTQQPEPPNAEATEQPEVTECQKTECDPKALAALENELNAQKDKFLRLSAEFDNYRKRTLREKQELVASAAGQTLLRLLPVVDDFDRALENAKHMDAETPEGPRAVLEGLELIQKSLLDFLKNSGVREIEALGQDLDTDYHDAVTKLPTDDQAMKGKIINIIKKGYTLNGTVLRHAQVVIGE